MDVPTNVAGSVQLRKKGITPMNLSLLLLSLEAIERACTQQRSNTQYNRRLPTRARKETRGLVLVPSLRARFPRELALRSIATCSRNMGSHIPHTIQRIVVGE